MIKVVEKMDAHTMDPVNIHSSISNSFDFSSETLSFVARSSR
jgi:hypothetical protein